MEAPSGQHSHRPFAPPVLLSNEVVQVTGRDTLADRDRHIAGAVAGVVHPQAGIDVLGLANQREAANGVECGPPVDSGGPNADGSAESITGWLDEPIEQFLGRPGAPLNPVHLLVRVKELRALHDPYRRVVHVGD